MVRVSRKGVNLVKQEMKQFKKVFLLKIQTKNSNLRDRGIATVAILGGSKTCVGLHVEEN